MDFTGAKRYSRENDDSEEMRYFRALAESLIARVHPEQRFDPLSHDPVEPAPQKVIYRWRLGGYYLANFLLPTRRRRHPLELESLIAGIRMRMEEYELELQLQGIATIEAFDVAACERTEAKAEKFLRLATHERTPPEEARAAALGLAKMIASSDVALLAWERVRHFAKEFERMKELFDKLQKEQPLLFFYGARGQRQIE